MRATAPVIFSAHGLPEAYIRKGDPYLDQIRITVNAVTRHLRLHDGRQQLGFQSRLGRQRWLGPNTEFKLVREDKVVPLSQLKFTPMP